ncbi:paraquat-inducible protein A [Qingshengfaniella alkalisoli]|uniref:Paraquat-inducible membrane protein A n=1 Tax=Qingshengfaniella alkalisoli TaxID=2599296 RepID=A0A5B8IZR7_9RHOB|nr:paraquat-inducible protein A [Qingshengfaniella alkalisoli]QDY70108.1 paraquat-inducible membrane protein A [Qingshengfaniella alkalisoli]
MATHHPTTAVLSARHAGLVGCSRCANVSPMGTTHCPTCGSRLFSRYPRSLQLVWAWWLAGLIAYIPANLFPMLITDTITSHDASTIIGGVIELIHYEDYFVAAVVFLASVVIPIAKFVAVAYLAMMVQMRRNDQPHRLHRLYEIVEFIGRWSMIDVFVVAILTSLVQLNVIAQIHPGAAAICFAISVIATMISAMCFDPRLLFDVTEGHKND